MFSVGSLPAILADAELTMLRDSRSDPRREASSGYQRIVDISRQRPFSWSIHGPIIVPRGAEARLW